VLGWIIGFRFSYPVVIGIARFKGAVFGPRLSGLCR
jgi:hypothetical protein